MAPSNGIQPWPSQCHPAMAPPQWHPLHGTPAMAPSNGAQQWHLAMAPQWHPNRTQQWHSTQQWHPPWHPAMAPYHGTHQWHHVQSVKVCHNHPPPIASSNGTLPHGTQQWHLTMAPSNGTTSSLSNMSKPAPAQWHPVMAPYDGT